jgi:hypothetical protein
VKPRSQCAWEPRSCCQGALTSKIAKPGGIVPWSLWWGVCRPLISRWKGERRRSHPEGSRLTACSCRDAGSAGCRACFLEMILPQDGNTGCSQKNLTSSTATLSAGSRRSPNSMTLIPGSPRRLNSADASGVKCISLFPGPQPVTSMSMDRREGLGRNLYISGDFFGR